MTGYIQKISYEDFLKAKEVKSINAGFNANTDIINPMLFDFQKDIVKWAIKKGKAALFEDCGLGKTPQQLEWAWQVHIETGGDILIIAPLAVAAQTKLEGVKFGVEVNICRSQEDVVPGINITNYEMIEHFDISKFVGVVLDESSILKGFNRHYSSMLIDICKDVPYKLSCTATPAPNDYMELGTQCEWLGVMTRTEMLATFFVHDGGETSKWRLKGHAEDKFWEWVASWAVVIRKPSDLGYEDGKFTLPELKIYEHIVKSEKKVESGQTSLIPEIAKTLSERRNARRLSLRNRVKKACSLANSNSEQWLVWCDLNAESEALAKEIIESYEVKGSDKPDYKEATMLGFAKGNLRALISKPTIAGWGLNFQTCHNMIFVGLSDSYEAFYQAVRRCYRFGQTKKVNVHIITSEAEGAVKVNIERKEKEANKMFDEMVKHTQKILTEEVHGTIKETIDYNPQIEMIIPEWIRSEVD
jgi:hypothetical protein